MSELCANTDFNSLQLQKCNGNGISGWGADMQNRWILQGFNATNFNWDLVYSIIALSFHFVHCRKTMAHFRDLIPVDSLIKSRWNASRVWTFLFYFQYLHLLQNAIPTFSLYSPQRARYFFLLFFTFLIMKIRSELDLRRPGCHAQMRERLWSIDVSHKQHFRLISEYKYLKFSNKTKSQNERQASIRSSDVRSGRMEMEFDSDLSLPENSPCRSKMRQRCFTIFNDFFHYWLIINFFSLRCWIHWELVHRFRLWSGNFQNKILQLNINYSRFLPTTRRTHLRVGSRKPTGSCEL